MESSQGSFIPQRPTRGKVAAKSFRKVYVLSYVSYLIFFTTLIAVAGIFLYKLSLQSSLREAREQLIAQKNLFSQEDLDRVQYLNLRIDTAKQLVNSHASVYKVLTALDQVITDPVLFTGLKYDRTADPRSPQLILAANARQFNEIIFQEQILSTNPATRNFKITEVTLNTQPVDSQRLDLGVQEVVSVTMTTELSPAEINYTGLTIPLPSLEGDTATPNAQTDQSNNTSQPDSAGDESVTETQQ